MQNIPKTLMEYRVSAFASTIANLIYYFIAVGLGLISVNSFSIEAFLLGPWFMMISVATPTGLLLLPANIYIGWSLLYERHNPFLLLSLTTCIVAFIAITSEEFWDGFNVMTLPVLLPTLYVIFTAWYQPVKKTIRWCQLRKYQGIHFDEPE